MAIVNIKIGNRNFDVACQDGEESRLQKLANEINEKVNHLSQQMKHSNDNSLFIALTALMLQDELNEAKQKLSSLDINKISQADIAKKLSQQISDKYSHENSEILEAVTDYIDSLTDKINSFNKK